MSKRKKKAKSNPASGAALSAIAKTVRQYFADAEQFIRGERAELPDPGPIIASDHPKTSLIGPNPGNDATGPYIATYIAFTERPGKPAPKDPYLFDPWWFAIMRWLELSGRGFRINVVSPKGSAHPFYFVNFTVREFGVRRFIMDTPPGHATPDKGNYHDYRRIALRTERETVLVAETEYDMNAPFRGRDELLTLLAADFRKRLPRKKQLADVNITRVDFLNQLSHWFGLADQLFARHYGGAPPKRTSTLAP